jgi:hypothetical protein
MNYCGNFVVLDEDITNTNIKNFTKQWYILYSKPRSEHEFYHSLSDSNIYLNVLDKSMEYDIHYKNNIMDHIKLFKK